MTSHRRFPIVVALAPGQAGRVESVLLGLEEEQVSAAVVEKGVRDVENAEALANAAADAAAFDVGIGLDEAGNVVLKHASHASALARLGPDADALLLRQVGHDAGRLVRRMPLQHVRSGATWPHPIRPKRPASDSSTGDNPTKEQS